MKGSCLCGGVVYEIDPPFTLFQYCHCSRCRKFSGSAHAANIYVPPERFRWLAGEELVGRYEVPEAKYFATGFCRKCGSCLPWQAKGARNIIVPAGTLDEAPPVQPAQNIFWDSRAPWYVVPDALPRYAELPPRKKPEGGKPAG